jgi:DNA-nicking Smr family endonuclease
LIERADATLDLHRVRARDAPKEIARFARTMQAAGALRVLIVHGKGLHSRSKSADAPASNPVDSDRQSGVLGSITIDALTEGPAAPYVQAFATALPSLGGTGAIIVALARRRPHSRH